MNRRTADRIRLLSGELLREHDEKRIATLAAELRSELRKHLKQLRARLAVTEIRERRLRNGATYDLDEMLDPSIHASVPGSAETSKQGEAVGDPPLPPPGSAPARTEPQIQAKEGDPLQGANGGTEIKAS